MNLIDLLDVHAMINNSNDMFLLLSDYTLDNRIDRNVLNRVIIKELGNARPITTNSICFKMLLDTFFDKYNLNITRLIDTMYYEYNPLTNKDVTETEQENRHSVGDIDNTDKYTTNTINKERGTTTSEDTVSAYDSATYQPKQKTVTTPNTDMTNNTDHEGETTSDIVSTVDTDKERHITGKDGNDSIQSLIEQERKLAEFNIFKWIISQMRKELFLLVY